MSILDGIKSLFSGASPNKTQEDRVPFKGGHLWATASHLDAADAPVILVHDNSAPASSWLKELTDLRRNTGKPVIAFDLPGHGKSDRFDFTEYSVQSHVDALAELCRHYDIKNRGAFFAGAGYGGHVVLQALGRSKINAKGVVLSGTQIYNGSLPLARAHEDEALRRVMDGRYQFQEGLSEAQIEEYAQALYSDADPDEAGSAAVSVPDDLLISVKETDQAVRNAVRVSYVRGDFQDEMQILKQNGGVDLLVMMGEHDAFVDPDRMEGSIRDLSGRRRSYVPLPDAGHAVMTRNAAEFNDTLNRFIESCASAAPAAGAGAAAAPAAGAGAAAALDGGGA